MSLHYTIQKEYLEIPQQEVFERINTLKKQLGEKVVILGHHYQRDDVIQFTDITGDSLKLSQYAAAEKNTPYIIFCGVHFMAETADILTRKDQIVTLPDLKAGCPMADMAPMRRVLKVWKRLEEICGDTIVPITYINSTAALKAFCAQKGGTVCTSSNADKILTWALKQKEKILFLPDRHLGTNISKKLGIPDDKITLVTRKTSPEEIKNATILLWQGHCPVHDKFSAKGVKKLKEESPETNILVHPECPKEVFELSDYNGSTEYIINTIRNAAPGTSWAIGTETHLVGRLKKQHPDKNISILTTSSCMCSMMDRISEHHLLWNLEHIAQGTPINQIIVPEDIKKDALTALNKMIELSR